jgi:hypothetical protein
MKMRGLLGAVLLLLSSTALVQAQAPASPYAHSAAPAAGSQTLNNMTKPLTNASGGPIQPLYPQTPTAAELKKLLDPESVVSEVEKVAARIQYDVANAAARLAAVRYLSTVDCHVYPEVEDALLAGLRGDRNESVRYEAALALSKCCGSSKKTIAALLIVVHGTDIDGKPAETSERVKTLAKKALEHGTSRLSYQAASPKPPEGPPQPKDKPESVRYPTTSMQLAAYHPQQVAPRQTAQIVDEGCRYIAETASTSPATRALPTCQYNYATARATISAPVNGQDDKAYDEAVQALLARQGPSPPPAPLVAPLVQRVEPPRPVMLTGPSPLLNAGQ